MRSASAFAMAAALDMYILERLKAHKESGSERSALSLERAVIKSVDLLSMVLLLVGVIWGIVQRIHLPAVPLATLDTWGYLNPALSWLSGQGFQQTYGRDWFYPAILFVTLKTGGDFIWILRLQQCLSLLAAPLLWVGVRLWLSIFPRRSVLCHSVGVLLGAIAAFVYAVGTTQIQLELAIGPEGVLAFFLMACLVSALAYFRARWVTLRTGFAIVFGSVVLVSGYAVILLKPSCALAFIPVFFLVMAGIFGAGRRYLRLAPAVVGVLLLAVFSAVPYLVPFKRDLSSRTFLPFILVSIHAAQIVENAERHHLLASGEEGLDNVERRFYQDLARAYNEARLKPFLTKTLGFNYDYILYGSQFFSTLQSEERLTADQLIRLCYSEYFRAWRESPDLMAGKVAKQFRLFLTAPRQDLAAYTLTKRRFIDSAPYFASAEWLTAEGKKLGYINQPFYTRYLAQLDKVYAEGLQIHQVNVQQRYLAVLFAKGSFWIQLAFFVAFFCVLLSRRFVDMRRWGWACASVAAILYGNVLTVSIVHTLDYDRYRTSYASALLLILVIMTVFVIGCSERLFRTLVSRSVPA
ncbi:MAG: hypothetical protein JO025_13310 [Verrucomicrobia bacterium]|nr:hypothetical protein [Verrucomicrobiota bacterium]